MPTHCEYTYRKRSIQNTCSTTSRKLQCLHWVRAVRIETHALSVLGSFSTPILQGMWNVNSNGVPILPISEACQRCSAFPTSRPIPLHNGPRCSDQSEESTQQKTLCDFVTVYFTRTQTESRPFSVDTGNLVLSWFIYQKRNSMNTLLKISIWVLGHCSRVSVR